MLLPKRVKYRRVHRLSLIHIYLLRLYNTIYYKSSWRDAFESSRTREDVFTAANGAKQKTDFMHLSLIHI